MSKPTILIVEDHNDFRHAVCDFITSSGINANLVEASSGEEGVTVAHKTKPRLVLMDFWLRGINGVQAASKIKQDAPNCSIIMLSMFDAKDIHGLDKDKSIKTFISKSDLTEKLLPEIKKVLLC